MSDEIARQILGQIDLLSNRQKLQIIHRLSASILDNAAGGGVSSPNSKHVVLPTDDVTHQIIGSCMKVYIVQEVLAFVRIPFNEI